MQLQIAQTFDVLVWPLIPSGYATGTSYMICARLQTLSTCGWLLPAVTVWISSATPDLLLIQQNLFCWISNRPRVAHLNYTDTELIQTVTDHAAKLEPKTKKKRW